MKSRKLIDKTDDLLRKETGTVFKDAGGKVNICLVYPNTYYVGMSNLGFQGLYGLINSRADALAERAFLPDQEDIPEFQRTGTLLFSIESKRFLKEFHLIAFSVSFENDYPNILKILELAGIKPRSEERTEQDPLIIGGGVALTANPEPLAEVFDAVFIGEADDAVDEIVNALNEGENKKEVLEALMRIEGMYVPSAYRIDYHLEGSIKSRRILWQGAPEVVRRRVTEELTGKLRHSIITEETEFSGMTLVEAMRGCPWSCGFCLAGHIYGPVRHKKIEVLKNEAEGKERIGLIGPSLTEYRYIKEALKEGFQCSITSVRASNKAVQIIQYLSSQKSISIAPESSERLRTALGKILYDEQILETCKHLSGYDLRSLRCYFMVGLPDETDSDIEAIIELVKNIRSVLKKGKIVVSISVFVPKPHTPLQWHPMAGEESTKAKLKKIKKELSVLKNTEVFHEVPKYSYLQGLLSRGDRRLCSFLIGLQNPSQWKKTLQRAGLNEEFYLYRQRDLKETLPWDFIDTGNKKEDLWQRYQSIIKKTQNT